MKIAFWGTPELTTTILDELLVQGLTPSIIITGQDVPIGRKMTITPPAAKVWGETHDIPVLQPAKLDEEFFLEIRNLNLDLSVVVAYGKIIPERFITLPRLGTINIHYSLLPKYRGATPVESAILNGDTETGVTIQHMRYALDSGPIIQMEKLEIEPTETSRALRARLNEIGKKLLVSSIRQLESGTATFTEQDESQATFCKKIKKEDGLIDPSGDAVANYNKFRAYFGWPGIYFMTNPPAGGEQRIKITDAILEDGKFIIKKVIPEGKKETDYKNFLENTH